MVDSAAASVDEDEGYEVILSAVMSTGVVDLEIIPEPAEGIISFTGLMVVGPRLVEVLF